MFWIFRIFCEISSFFSLRLFPEWQIRPNFHKFSYQLSKRQIAEKGENDVPFWNNLFFLQTIYYSAYYILLMRHKQLNYEVADTKCVTVNQRHLTASLFKRKNIGRTLNFAVGNWTEKDSGNVLSISRICEKATKET